MKQLVLALCFILFLISLLTFGFTFNQTMREEERMRSDLQTRVVLLADSLKESIEPSFLQKSYTYLQSIVERFANKEQVSGIGVFDETFTPIVVSSLLQSMSPTEKNILVSSKQQNTFIGEFISKDNKSYYMLAVPLRDNEEATGALMLVHDASYITSRVNDIWQYNLVRLLFQVLLITTCFLFAVHWLMYRPLRNLASSIQTSRAGGSFDVTFLQNSFLFRPLTKEISDLKRSLVEARLAASEEARLSLEKIDSPWTAERLKEFVKDILKNRQLVVVSSREPYIHIKKGNGIEYYQPASGMVTAIEPLMQACGGTWIAHGSGDADKAVVDEHDTISVPPQEPKYSLKRVWLTPDEESKYYNGFSNEGLWPLFHNAHTRPIFRKDDWEQYKKVNEKFAHVVLDQIKNVKRPIVLIQDFHFCLLAKMIKKKRPDATIGLFWHIPWVSAESFSICPWKKEILMGMLGADLIGFHTQLHCNNFIESVGRELESLINFEQYTVTKEDHTSVIKPFPISIAFSNDIHHVEDESADFKPFTKLGVHTPYIAFGVDRMDYTKGILERLKAVEIFLRKYPQYQERFTFVQIAAPSRSKIKKYQDFTQDVKQEVERINSLYKRKNWKPIVLDINHHNHGELNDYYRGAQVCLVTSLHDGMNLVAKEFIAARSDEKGVLILSQFTGAVREFNDALVINPYNAEQTATAIYTALEMSLAEQTKRMKKMRNIVRHNNVFRWSAEYLKTLVNLG